MQRQAQAIRERQQRIRGLSGKERREECSPRLSRGSSSSSSSSEANCSATTSSRSAKLAADAVSARVLGGIRRAWRSAAAAAFFASAAAFFATAAGPARV